MRPGSVGAVRALDELRRGRTAFANRAWADTAAALVTADAEEALAPEDLELLATATYLLGDEEEQVAILERAYDAYRDVGSVRAAGRCAFWIGMQLFMRGEIGRGGGWLGRAHELLDAEEDCPERGYLLLPDVFRQAAAGDLEGAVETAAAAAAVGRRCRDADLVALAAHAQSQFLIAIGRVSDGLRLLDEALVSIMSGAVSPIPTGIVYCGAILGCQAAFDARRAQEWTVALHAWCASQPDLVAFTGACHVHRAEIMQLHGEWTDALDELDRAAARAAAAGNHNVPAEAAYHRGEILRRKGLLAAAEAAYREAARLGREPQPGLALVRLAQGDTGASAAAIRRVLEGTRDPGQRARMLPACAEIMLAAGDHEAARLACAELGTIAAERPSEMLAAMLAHARGAVALGGGDPRAALPLLRDALTGWHALAAPYEAARVRVLVARACRTLGDEDTATLELDAARETLAALGAVVEPGHERDAHGLSDRELEVLRMVAAGATNKAIAGELVLSERTVDRHVSNILAKLRVSSRAAATAYAYQHKLL